MSDAGMAGEAELPYQSCLKSATTSVIVQILTTHWLQWCSYLYSWDTHTHTHAPECHAGGAERSAKVVAVSSIWITHLHQYHFRIECSL